MLPIAESEDYVDTDSAAATIDYYFKPPRDFPFREGHLSWQLTQRRDDIRSSATKLREAIVLHYAHFGCSRLLPHVSVRTCRIAPQCESSVRKSKKIEFTLPDPILNVTTLLQQSYTWPTGSKLSEMKIAFHFSFPFLRIRLN